MKKIFSLITSLFVMGSILIGCAIPVSAFFGVGTQVVAKDVCVIKTGISGQKMTFSDADIKSALAIPNFDSITITEIPSSTEGTLLLGGRRVGKGRLIKRKNLSTLVFVPASPSVTQCSFKFTVDNYSGGAEIECIMKFIDKINYAPDAIAPEESYQKTQSGISVFGNLEATDPEGDAIEFIIVSYPSKGGVALVDDNGRYCYTPKDGFTGKDKFTYVARDEYGNYSKPVTMNIKVIDRMCDTVYRDMEDREEYNAAVAMTAMGIMGGRKVGDDLYFDPDDKISRAEFVAMAMKCTGVRADPTLTSTYFDDDNSISPSLKSYIATAQRIGIVNGDFKDGKLVFSPNEEITKYEAAKIISTIIGADNEGEESVFATDIDIPVWARGGVYAMCSLGVFDMDDQQTLNESVSRSDIAQYLYKVSKII